VHLNGPGPKYNGFFKKEEGEEGELRVLLSIRPYLTYSGLTGRFKTPSLNRNALCGGNGV
jgi:hypothetical protein